MKADLTYEQCRDLEKWGLDQTLQHGDWYYNKSDNEASVLAQKEFGPFLYCITCHEDEPPERPIKVPSTEQMWDFLGQKCLEVEQVFFTDHIEFIARDLPRGDWPTSREVKGKEGWGKNLSQALYALCEKVFGGKEQTKGE